MTEPTKPIDVYIAKSGHETGPFQKEQIQPMLDSGMLALTDSVWHKDLAGWMPVHQYLGLRPPVPVVPVRPHLPNEVPGRMLRSGDPAPFGRRFCAHFIDCMACSTLSLLFAIIMVLILGGTSWNPELLETSSQLATFINVFVVMGTYVVVLVVPTWLYHALWESSSRQASIGKLSCGLVVTDLEGRRITFSRASKRSLGKAASQSLGAFGLIFLTCFWSAKKQCLHDIRADCLVVLK